MANRRVAVYKQVKVNGVWVKCPPYINPKNRKPENDKVLVGGKMEIHPEGEWGIFYYEGSKRRWKKIGPKYAEAKRAADIKELALRGRATGALVVTEESEKTSLQAAIDTFLADINKSRRPKTYQLLKYDLQEFCDWVKKPYLEDLTREDVLGFKKYVLRTPEKPRTKSPHTAGKLRSERTANNKAAEVNQFYRWSMKLDPGKGLITMKDVKSDEEDVEVFTQKELDGFFAACTPAQHLLFTTFLQTGLRKQEMMHLVWDSVDLVEGTIKVKANKELAFRTKTGKGRTVPLPQDLLSRLTAHKEATKGAKSSLVFPTRSGKVDNKMWETCKRVAIRAGLDPAKFFIHKFRATYATTCLRQGVDLKSVQDLLGHSGKDLSSTTRYLAVARMDVLKPKIESVWGKADALDMPHVYADFLGGTSPSRG